MASLPAPDDSFLLLMADHVTHHRAQMLVYLRLKGIVPPNYIEFQ